MNVANVDGATPLIAAALKGHVDTVEVLLQREDVDVNVACKDGATPLLLAAQNGHGKTVEALLKKDGIDVNKPRKNGDTPLSRAEHNGHEKVVNLLLADQMNAALKGKKKPLATKVDKVSKLSLFAPKSPVIVRYYETLITTCRYEIVKNVSHSMRP